AAGLRDRFGDNAGSYLVAVLRGPDVFTPEALASVAAISEAITTIPRVRQVVSLSTVPFVRGRGDELSLEPVTGLAERGHDVVALRADVLESPLYVRRLISPDGKTTAVLGLLDADHRSIRERAPTIEAFRHAVEVHMPPGFTVLYTGYPVTEAEYARMVLQGFALAQVVGLSLIALTLYLTFRTWPAVVLPLVTVGISTVLVLGMIELTGQRLTFTNSSVPLLLLVIGVAEVSFYVARFYEEAAGGWDDELPVRAAASALWPGFIAGGTTSAGFLALGAGHIGLTRDFGFNMSIASLLTVGVAAALIPGALARLGKPPERALRAVEGGGITRFLTRIAGTIHERPVAGGLGALAVCVFGLLGSGRITLDQYATRELASQHPILVAQRAVDSELSGAFQ
ncbi:MAG: efflux RND transporter permease subunit, partial [Candidatus Rokuibacteriota bacterium]